MEGGEVDVQEVDRGGTCTEIYRLFKHPARDHFPSLDGQLQPSYSASSLLHLVFVSYFLLAYHRLA